MTELRKFTKLQTLSFDEDKRRIDLVMKIYNRFTTPQIEKVLHALYMQKVTNDSITPINVITSSLPCANFSSEHTKRKYKKREPLTPSDKSE